MTSSFRTALGTALIGVFFGMAGVAAAAPLLQKNNLIYQGGFRLPEVPYGGGFGATYGFDYATTSIAYNPEHDSLFINNHIYEQKTAEVSIPPLSADMRQLATAAFLQTFSEITEGNLRKIGAGGADYGATTYMGGLLVYGSKLIGSAYGYYDAGGNARLSHFTSGLNLSQSGDFRGMYQVSTLNPGFVGGYMAQVPAEWRAALGGPALTGQCCIAIISRSSMGPAAFVFDPGGLGVQNPVPATPLVYYDSQHPTLGEWGNQTEPNLYYNMSTKIDGLVLPAGTQSLLFFGTQGTGTPCYGEGGAVRPPNAVHWCYDPANGSKGTHSYPYKYWVWAYDVRALISVKNGEKRPWEVKPYAVWSLDLPLTVESGQIQGVAYDPTTQRVFISQVGAAGMLPGASPYEEAPLIQVFKVDAALAPDPAPAPPRNLRVG